jgi:hypothetical protein
MKTTKQIIPFLLVLFYLPALAKDHHISLEDQSVKIRNFGFYIEKVTNATGEDKLIGFVEKTISYTNVPAYFDNEIAVEIEMFLNRNLEKSNGTIPLVVRIDKIQISETYNGVVETAKANVDLTFIFREKSEFYKKLSTKVTKQKSSSMGISKSQPEIIADAIAQCFDDFYMRKMEGKLENTKISEQHLYESSEDDQLIERLFALNRSKKGIYKTFYDFQYNTPDTTIDFEVTYKIKSNKDEDEIIKEARIFNNTTNKEIEKMWGFCDGNNNYIYVNKDYIPLEKDSISHYIMIKVYDQATMTYAGIMGGLIGSSIAAASTPVSKVRLNLLNGELYPDENADELVSATNKNKGSIIFFSSRFNKKTSAIELYMNDEFVCVLTKGSWYQHELTSDPETINVTLKSSNGMSSSAEITPKLFENNIYLCIDKKRKKPNIDKILLNRKDDFTSVMSPDNRVYAGTKE